MIKFNSALKLETWALPLAVAWNGTPVYRVFQINVLCFGFQWVYINMPKVEETAEEETEAIKSRKDRRAEFKATKAYADGRQKMKHNRKRKPSKPMANTYQLEG